ncbi:MAG: L-cysteate sulfo-lyase [Pseudomonadota bacterium]
MSLRPGVTVYGNGATLFNGFKKTLQGVAGFVGNRIDLPIVGVGVSRDPEQQEPLVLKEAQAVADLLGLGLQIPRESVIRC